MAKHGRQRDRRREERWRGILRRQADSGVSIRQFCCDHRLAESSFYFWRRELGRRGREEGPAAFVAVQVTPEAMGAEAGRIEVMLPGAWRVRVEGAVDRTVLADVLAAVAEAQRVEASVFANLSCEALAKREATPDKSEGEGC